MINVVMAVVFLLIGIFLIYRTRIVKKMRLAYPADPIAFSLVRTQLIADLAMATLGYVLATAAILRVWREILPVFG